MLHIHNGDSVLMTARRANLPGEQIAFRDTLVMGPIAEDDWIESRARFLSEAYGEKLLRARNVLLEQERSLDAAATHDEVVLWFEHDLFCLVNFLYLLKRLAGHPRVTTLWCDEQLCGPDPTELRTLYPSRRAVPPGQSAAGAPAAAAAA